MVRVIYAAAVLVLAVLYYYFFGAGPTPSEIADLQWWQPRGWAQLSESFSGLREMSKVEGGITRLIPVLIAAVLPVTAGIVGFRLFKGPVARVAIFAISLSLVAFGYYGYLGVGIWRIFSWRWPAVTLSMCALIAAVLFSPSLLRSAMRLPVAGRVVALLATAALVYMLSIEITGTDPTLFINLSPWPILTVFGFLLIGYLVAAMHVGAGVGMMIWDRMSGMSAAACGVVASALVSGVAAWALFQAQWLIVVAAVLAAAYALVTHIRSSEEERGASAGYRIAAGLLLVALIWLSNSRAVSYQSEARDETSPLVIAALEAYKAERGQYPDALSDLVPDFLPAVPRPRIGVIEHSDEVFVYSNFGDSYALEFPAPQWTQCAYSPPYDDSWYDEEEGDDPNAGAPATPDVAAGDGESLEGSWSCASAPPELW